MPIRPETGEVRIAELVASLSYAADLGLGQPMEHCLRQTVIALRLATLSGAGDQDREATYYLGLMMNLFCHADASEQAKWYGDDISFKADSYELLDLSTARMISLLLRRIGSHGTPMERAKRLAAFPLEAQQRVAAFLTTHATLGSEFAARIGLGDNLRMALRHEYEHWDGKGYPNRLRGEEICLPARLVQFAGPVEVYSRRGIDAAIGIARKHRASQFDPAIADLFCDHAPDVLDSLDEAADWDVILDAEPGLSRTVGGAELDDVLAAMADLIDLKSPYLAGHSRGVASLAAEAARVSGLSDDEITTLRRAALIHDMGRLGVSNTIWDKPGPLSPAELERVRLHPYLTDRMLARVSVLGRSRDIAARHHERLDGSGYPRGLTAVSLTPSDRLLAAADVYHAMIEPRPHRPPLDPDRASEQLRAEVKAGRLDGAAVNAVLTAAGHRAPARREWPAGLTAREVEVLELLARGHSNREIATKLGVTPKTVSNHVEHVYTKAAVSSRAAATLFATRHGLMGNFASA